MYQYSVFKFDDKEINQIVQLVKDWVRNLKPDQRKLTPNVRKYARIYNLVPKPNNSPLWVCVDYFDVLHHAPTEVLFRLVEPILTDHTGYSALKDKRWNTFNVNPGDTNNIELILLKLDWEGYISFLSSGSIWRIEILKR